MEDRKTKKNFDLGISIIINLRGSERLLSVLCGKKKAQCYKDQEDKEKFRFGNLYNNKPPRF